MNRRAAWELLPVDEPFARRFKVSTPHLHGLSLRSLFLIGILRRATRGVQQAITKLANAKRITMMKAKNQLSRFFSAASFWNFSIVRAST